MTDAPNFTVKEMLAYPVDEEMATSVAKMSDEKLVMGHFVNAFLAALGGKDSVFWKLSAAGKMS
jgi:hypothetical protein